MDNSIDPETRRKICDLISQHPGLHLSKIAELLNMKIRYVEQCLKELENNAVITAKENQQYKRYYIAERHLGLRDTRTIRTRKRIYDLIATNPGLHLSKIADLLNMRLSLAEYHLLNMEKDKVIVSFKDVGYYKRYYVAGSDVGFEKRKILSLLREDIPLKIVLFLIRRPNTKPREILKKIDITSSTLSYHLNKLVKYGILNIPLYAEEKGYTIKNRQEIIRLLKKYRLIPITTSFIDIWDDLKFK